MFCLASRFFFYIYGVKYDCVCIRRVVSAAGDHTGRRVVREAAR